jgi:hypothetical protein
MAMWALLLDQLVHVLRNAVLKIGVDGDAERRCRKPPPFSLSELVSEFCREKRSAKVEI